LLHKQLPEYKTDQTFAYHDPCELHRILEIKKEPRSLMNKMKVKYRDIKPSCCGGGGLLRMTDANLSDIIINMRAASEGLKETTVLTCCPSCREQLLSNNLKTRDIVELVAEALERGGD
ncbi:MAG: heterodisulfide reductase-related iron-sulfur binding cluster, partial [Candidatus Thorarchaeota archaeon]